MYMWSFFVFKKLTGRANSVDPDPTALSGVHTVCAGNFIRNFGVGKGHLPEKDIFFLFLHENICCEVPLMIAHSICFCEKEEKY